ncbi:PREDICTED: zeaxanthin epoxidase, chloroplastic-like isoform X1 [Lupinus angustifolius]|uniref:zeaxanthin epoxidase, chloroplastic-like isoform X1 n=1 Tax=Lupinus angustifolius TaxID=3871 RepID=UPI00092E74C3|nr:PREDICTED: zeaxanthin epoxidase, chloroplastic-like isoform X1 [Lupinus angustifolius]
MASVQFMWSCTQFNNNHGCIRITKPNMKRCLVRCEGNSDKVPNEEKHEKKKLRVLIAGGGIGGLVLALAAKKRGYEVKVFEKDLSAVRGEGRDRGAIQLLSGALSVLEAVDENVAKQIMEEGCVTGNRTNGLADGLSGEWFTKFDFFTPATRRGLPITLVICRIALQDVLVNAVGSNILKNKAKVVDFIQEPGKVRVILENGEHYDGDILVGADGIWSEVRSKLFGWQEANYSGFTCYTGLTHYVPPYNDTIGYRVFLGLNQYFVASDIGNGKMQWYAFQGQAHSSAPHLEGKNKKKRVLELFGKWCNDVATLISETPEHEILQRNIYDRDMINTWGIGRVTLLGDAAHPMQPNLGQGGCMAIEDSYQLILELDKVAKHGYGESEVISALRRYEKKRVPRVMIMHTATRMASKMVVNYKPYIEFNFWPLSQILKNIKIKHPGIVISSAFLEFIFPQFADWMLAGHGLL